MSRFVALQSAAGGEDVRRWIPPRVALELDLPAAPEIHSPTVEEVTAIEEEAKRAGTEAGLQQGYEAGYREGREQAAAEAANEQREREAREQEWRASQEREARATVAALEGIARQLADPLASSADALEPELLLLVTTLARRVIQEELTTHPELVARVLHEALGQLPSRNHRIRVHVNPEDQRILEIHASARGETITWIPDPGLEPGGCILESGPSRIDASLETRLRQGIEAIWGEVTPPPSANGDQQFEPEPEPDQEQEPEPESGQAPRAMSEATAPLESVGQAPTDSATETPAIPTPMPPETSP